jgi:hypothetical protein
MSDESHLRYANLKLTVSNMIAMLRWANVAANRGMKKVELQQLLGRSLLDGGPPALANTDDFEGFPRVVPESWSNWLLQHNAWQAPSTSSPLPRQGSIQALLNSEPYSATSSESFYVFDKRALQMRQHFALGTVDKLSMANENRPNVFERFPCTSSAYDTFKGTPRSRVVLWVVLEVA